MEPMIATVVLVALMGAVVLAFRMYIRAPRGLLHKDPPGVRTVATFSGLDTEFFRDDREDHPFVGVRLFDLLCAGLAAQGIRVENRGTVENAQKAECAVQDQRFGLVLEWIDERWVASIEWHPRTRAEKRHIAFTHQVFSPPDSPALRQLVTTLDSWLKANPKLSNVRWHRKEDWFVEDISASTDRPIASGNHGGEAA